MNKPSEQYVLFNPSKFLGTPAVVAPLKLGKISVALQFIILGLTTPHENETDIINLIKKCMIDVVESNIKRIPGIKPPSSLITLSFYIDYCEDQGIRQQIIDTKVRNFIERFLGLISYCAGYKASAKNIITTITWGTQNQVVSGARDKAKEPKIKFSIPEGLINGELPEDLFAALFWLRRGLEEKDPIERFWAFTICLQILARKLILEVPERNKCPNCGEYLPINPYPISFQFKRLLISKLNTSGKVAKDIWSWRSKLVAHGGKINLSMEDYFELTDLNFKAAELAYQGINLALGLNSATAPRPSQNFFMTDVLMNLD
jgi:hypothetical protein